jgi:sugar/nucleoside kinase (ribokinase family)
METANIIAGFGALNLDLIFEVDEVGGFSSERLRLESGREVSATREAVDDLLGRLAKTAVLRSKSGGGSAANTLVALARMGFPCRFIGKVGEDEAGDFLLEALVPVRTDWIRRGGRTGLCLSILDRHYDRALLVSGNANDSLTPEETGPIPTEDLSWLHLTSFVGEPPFEAQRDFLDRLPPRVGVSFDPGEIYGRKGWDALGPFMRRSRVVFVTEMEIGLLTGLGFDAGALRILECGPSIVVCKRGIRGSVLFTREEKIEIPCVEVEAVDNTGAGDVYNAGFLAGLLLKRPLRECGLFASRVAAKSVAAFGREGYPTEEDLEAFRREA